MLYSVPILACSPRAGGNSDAMAHAVAEGVRQAGGQAHVWYLRDFAVLPCTACGACFENAEQRCALEHKDDAGTLFSLLEGARPVVLTVPIFFYHVPAQLKALMDRGQKYWARQHSTKLGQKLPMHRSSLNVALVAARPRGENLFTGTLASLKLFAQLFQRDLGEVSLWKGYDAPHEFMNDVNAYATLQQWGQNLIQVKK